MATAHHDVIDFLGWFLHRSPALGLGISVEETVILKELGSSF